MQSDSSVLADGRGDRRQLWCSPGLIGDWIAPPTIGPTLVNAGRYPAESPIAAAADRTVCLRCWRTIRFGLPQQYWRARTAWLRGLASLEHCMSSDDPLPVAHGRPVARSSAHNRAFPALRLRPSRRPSDGGCQTVCGRRRGFFRPSSANSLFSVISQRAFTWGTRRPLQVW